MPTGALMGETVETAKPSDWLLDQGSIIDHFRIVRPLGRGGAAEVYLARDTKLGRKVAVKVIRGANEDLSGFLAEARATARFNHPHIVTVHAVGESNGLPYVALEYLEGETLRERIQMDAPTVRESMRIALAIAEALSASHAEEIIHRDLKPENIMLARDGRLRVLDFGLASVGTETQGIAQHDAAEKVAGTPAYMAPEQWKKERISGATDIWAFGMVLHELIAGTRPYQTEKTILALGRRVKSDDPVPEVAAREGHEVPAELLLLTNRCLEKNASRRPPSEEVLQTLRKLLAAPESQREEEESPFVGLMPFSERNNHLFFGRQTEIASFMERLRQQSVLPVVGPSGSGKTSFVQAGVIPRLREKGELIVIQLRPGHDPFSALATQLHLAESNQSLNSPYGTLRSGGALREGEEERLIKQLFAAPRLLNLALHRLADRRDCSILLFVDQLEELYTLVADEEVRHQFMEAICLAAEDEHLPVRVLFTLREEFLSRLASSPSVKEVLSHLTVLTAPGSGALAQILTNPLETVGYSFDDPQLAQEMVRAVEGELACLPLLQFAGQLLWERRDPQQRILRRASYDDIGGVAGALAQHADGVLAGLSADEIRLARAICLRLVTPEETRKSLTKTEALEGLERSDTETKRGTSGANVGDRQGGLERSDTETKRGTSGANVGDRQGGRERSDTETKRGTSGANVGGLDRADAVLERLMSARLITVRQAPGEVQIELAHESLVATWTRLRRWIDETREELVFLTEVGLAAELWEKRGRREEEVWQGATLQDARRAIDHCTTEVPRRVGEFVSAGERKEERRRRFSIGLVSFAFCVLVVVAIVLATKEREARQQRDRVIVERAEAERRRAEAQREGARAALEEDLLEARAKLRGSLEIEDAALSRALWWHLSREPEVWRNRFGSIVYEVDFSRDGELIAAGCADKTVYLLDATTRAYRQILRGHRDQVSALAFSLSGEQVVSGDLAGSVRIWNTKTGAVLKEIAAHRGSVDALAISDLLATGGRDGKVRFFDPKTGEARHTIEGLDRVYSVTFSPDGRAVAAAGDGLKVHVWDSQTFERKHVFEGYRAAIRGVRFSPGGKLLATSDNDRNVTIWNLETKEKKVLSGHRAGVESLDFSPDGKQIVTGGADKRIRIFEVKTGREVRTINAHRGAINAVRFGREGKRIATASADKTVRIFRSEVEVEERFSAGHEGLILGVAFSPDGMLLATAGFDRTVRIWDVQTGAQRRVLSGYRAAVLSLAFDQDGLLATGADDGSVRLSDPITGRRQGIFAAHTHGVWGLDFSPDGSLIATCSTSGRIRLWNSKTKQLVKELVGHNNKEINNLSFSPDGKRLASAGEDKTARVWDVASGRELMVLKGHTAALDGVRFHPDGQRLVTGSRDKTVRLWDLKTKKSEVVGKFDGKVYWLDFHPDGAQVGVPTSDGRAHLLNLETKTQHELVGHRGEVNYLRFSKDGALAATTSDDETVRVWDVKRSRAHWRVPLVRVVDGTIEWFSHQGWQREGATVQDGQVLEEKTQWRKAVADRSYRAAVRGSLLCLASQGRLEIWNLQEDDLLASHAAVQIEQVVATDSSCLVRDSDRVLLLGQTGTERSLVEEGAKAMAWRDPDLLVATDHAVLLLSADGKERKRLEASNGITALTRTSADLVVGYVNGSVDRIDFDDEEREHGFFLEDAPSSPVVALLEGPRSTLIVGFANGLLGLWSRKGERLEHTRLHGPVRHLLLQGSSLHAVSDLGNHVVWDLSMLQADRCALLRSVWERVPVLWEAGQPVLRAPPAKHVCIE